MIKIANEITLNHNWNNYVLLGFNLLCSKTMIIIAANTRFFMQLKMNHGLTHTHTHESNLHFKRCTQAQAQTNIFDWILKEYCFVPFDRSCFGKSNKKSSEVSTFVHDLCEVHRSWMYSKIWTNKSRFLVSDFVH